MPVDPLPRLIRHLREQEPPDTAPAQDVAVGEVLRREHATSYSYQLSALSCQLKAESRELTGES
jgi:hypothetical protein